MMPIEQEPANTTPAGAGGTGSADDPAARLEQEMRRRGLAVPTPSGTPDTEPESHVDPENDLPTEPEVEPDPEADIMSDPESENDPGAGTGS